MKGVKCRAAAFVAENEAIEREVDGWWWTSEGYTKGVSEFHQLDLTTTDLIQFNPLKVDQSFLYHLFQLINSSGA